MTKGSGYKVTGKAGRWQSMFGKAADNDAEHEDRDEDVHQLVAFLGVSGKLGSDRR